MVICPCPLGGTDEAFRATKRKENAIAKTKVYSAVFKSVLLGRKIGLGIACINSPKRSPLRQIKNEPIFSWSGQVLHGPSNGVFVLRIIPPRHSLGINPYNWSKQLLYTPNVLLLLISSHRVFQSSKKTEKIGLKILRKQVQSIAISLNDNR